jgi:polygalacturonase
MTTLIPKFKQTGTGAVNNPINIKLGETVSVLDFGADPTGTTDSYAAIMAAIASLGESGTVYFQK